MPIGAQGGTAIIDAEVRSAGGLADPQTLSLTLRTSAGATLAGFPVGIPPIVRDSLGRYHYDWSIPLAQALGTYTALWSGTVNNGAISGSDTVEVVVAGTIASVTSVVSVDDVRALVASGLTTAQLQAVIDREEAALARRIGPLAGPRTVTYQQGGGSTLRLQRPARAVSVGEGGIALGSSAFALLSDGRSILRTGASWWSSPTAVTYTPDDLAEVRRVVIELVRLTVNQTGYESEQVAGEYSYKALPAGEREALIRSLLPRRSGLTSRLMSAGYAA